ncbi:MAG: Gp49 family protein [Eubacteriales bacterium]|nr:Gp49 family protein [Eubacteriales bacterium]
MVRYIGTKLIEAIPAQKDGEDGYKVVYPDGYNSWSPADVFERAYLPLSINTRLNTDKPSIGQEMVDDFIAHTEVQTLGDKTTVVRAVLRNGFELVESSSCVSKENYSEELGAQICMKKLKDKVWFLLGFLLQTAVHGVKEQV